VSLNSARSVLLLPVILLTCLALAPLARAQDRVKDPAGLFSLVPPQGWAVSLVQTAKESQVRADLASPQAFLTVSARRLPPDMTWPAWRAWIKKTSAQKLSPVEFGPFRLCGGPALAVLGRSLESKENTVEMVALERQGVGFVLTMAYPSQLWKKFRPILEEVLKSFWCHPSP